MRDLILTGNLMAQKIGQDPNNLANTWDEMVIRLRASGVLEKVAMMELRAEQKAEAAGAAALIDKATS